MQLDKGVFDALSKVPESNVDLLVENGISVLIHGLEKVYPGGWNLLEFVFFAATPMQFNEYLTQLDARREKGWIGIPPTSYNATQKRDKSRQWVRI